MLQEIQDFCLAILKHWGPLVTGVSALVVSVVVGALWEDHAPLWVWLTIVGISILVSSFLAWRTTKRDSYKDKKELIFLKTPSVSIKLHQIDSGSILDGHIQTLHLEVIGIGIDYVRPEVFALSIEEIERKHPRDLHISPDIPVKQFGVRRNESENVPCVVYNSHSTSQLCVLLPCKKITSEAVLRADYFKMKVCAYAGPKEAEIEFEFGVDRELKLLWMRPVGSTEKIYSRQGDLLRKM